MLSGYKGPMHTPLHKLAVALVAVILGAVTVAGCKEPTPASGNRLLLVGDSIFALSRGTLEEVLKAEGWEPFVSATGGTTIEDWSTGIQPAVELSDPNVVVVELGTNDCGPVGCVNLAPYIDALMRQLTSADAVLWLTVQTDKAIPQKPDYVNFEIEAAVARWPNLFLVDMGSAFEGHPEWTDDGIHPNAEGERQMAALVAESLRPFLPRAA